MVTTSQNLFIFESAKNSAALACLLSIFIISILFLIICL